MQVSFIIKSLPSLRFHYYTELLLSPNVLMVQNSSLGLPWLFPSSFTQLRWTKEEQILGLYILLAQPLFALCWAWLKEILEESRRILRGLPRVPRKVSCMLFRASSLITQSVSQAETQAKLFFNYLFRNTSPCKNMSSVRVRIESHSFETPQVLAGTLDHSHLLINICQIKKSEWRAWHLYWYSSKNKIT